MIRIKLDESNALDESKAILPVVKVLDWYFDPANANKPGRRAIQKVLNYAGITEDELEDKYDELSWEAKVDISRAVRGW